MNSTVKTARIAGFLYLLVAIFGTMTFSIQSSLIVNGDVAATVNNIATSELQFRIGIVSEVVMLICFILLPLALFKLLKTVNKSYAWLMVIFALISVPISFINMINPFTALLLLNGTDYSAAFEVNQLHTLVMMFLEMQEVGHLIAKIFYGLWLFPLGYLVFKSGFLPRIIGIIVMIACFAYLIEVFMQFLFPSFEYINYPLVVFVYIAEFSLVLWLLIKGAAVKK